MADQAECAAEEQNNELVLMTAMYERDLELFFSGELIPDVPPPRNYSVKLEISGSIVELFVSVPVLYPIVEYPSIRVSADCEEFEVNELNAYLRSWLHKQELGEPLIAQLIEELRGELHSFTSRRAPDGCGGSMSSGETVRSEYDDKFARYWILSHHMYSQAKRHEVVKQAKAHGITGFSTPGKPAVIVVEGDASLVQDYWSYIRTMSWHKITLMEQEFVPSSRKDFLRFSCFKELCFDAGGDHKKVDIAEVRKLLEENGLEKHFRNLYNM
ncbi:hypothetical protein PFISCL1PPCAC_9676 [Pristionchus fissidentatus]|uniref:RWD domain-containing protein n=1 Tax=Pristionchus fissidentatus TaxID=1538716 RepID=A0AAV5VG24_9BILA|nr:hypothetical protein PFISCL1PPCAC_9676 [Pristionchus fissidentatus]